MLTMTGKELMIYILLNNLEDEVVISNGVFAGIISVEEAAAKFGVGVPTVMAWYRLGKIPGFTIGDVVFIRNDATDPRTNTNQGS